MRIINAQAVLWGNKAECSFPLSSRSGHGDRGPGTGWGMTAKLRKETNQHVQILLAQDFLLKYKTLENSFFFEGHTFSSWFVCNKPTSKRLLLPDCDRYIWTLILDLST